MSSTISLLGLNPPHTLLSHFPFGQLVPFTGVEVNCEGQEEADDPPAWLGTDIKDDDIFSLRNRR